jgi:hypothetical protein
VTLIAPLAFQHDWKSVNGNIHETSNGKTEEYGNPRKRGRITGKKGVDFGHRAVLCPK